MCMSCSCIYLLFFFLFFFFKQKTAYEMRISDWSSDVCSSDLSTLTALRSRLDSSRASASVSSLALPSPISCRFPSRCKRRNQEAPPRDRDRKSVVEGKSVSVRVDLGGRRIIKKKTHI